MERSRRASPSPPDLLDVVSRRTRQLRQARGLTLKSLADQSGLSLRFLMEVEAGRGNISIRRLSDLAGALQTTASELVMMSRPGEEDASRRVISLLGLRGAGKTTIGKRLARKLRVPFVELDQRIEARAGMTLG